MILGQLVGKCRFGPILAKMGTPKNGEMSLLMVKRYLVLETSNRNIFLTMQPILKNGLILGPFLMFFYSNFFLVLKIKIWKNPEKHFFGLARRT